MSRESVLNKFINYLYTLSDNELKVLKEILEEQAKQKRFIDLLNSIIYFREVENSLYNNANQIIAANEAKNDMVWIDNYPNVVNNISLDKIVDSIKSLLNDREVFPLSSEMYRVLSSISNFSKNQSPNKYKSRSRTISDFIEYIKSINNEERNIIFRQLIIIARKRTGLDQYKKIFSSLIKNE